jgi:hypothetical protein
LWERAGGRKRGRRMNIAQIHVYVYKRKMIPFETFPGIRGVRMRESGGKG